MKFGVVITNYNGLSNLLECLSSIASAEADELEIVVVDNGSTDGSCQLVRSKFPNTRLILNDANLGFGHGTNQGSELLLEAGADVLVMLNNDTVVGKDFFAHLERVLSRYPDAVAIAPKIRNYYHPEIIESAGGSVTIWKGAPKPRGYGRNDSAVFDEEMMTASISGPAIIVTRSLVERVGLLDPSYFLGAEDVEYSLRILTSGAHIIYAPTVQLSHKAHQSGMSASSGSLSIALGNFFCTRNSLKLLAANGTLFEKVEHAYYLLLAQLPSRMIMGARSHQLIVRPLVWAFISRINPRALPPDDIMVRRLLE
jgi:hypothetical protein